MPKSESNKVRLSKKNNLCHNQHLVKESSYSTYKPMDLYSEGLIDVGSLVSVIEGAYFQGEGTNFMVYLVRSL